MEKKKNQTPAITLTTVTVRDESRGLGTILSTLLLHSLLLKSEDVMKLLTISFCSMVQFRNNNSLSCTKSVLINVHKKK